MKQIVHQSLKVSILQERNVMSLLKVSTLQERNVMKVLKISITQERYVMKLLKVSFLQEKNVITMALFPYTCALTMDKVFVLCINNGHHRSLTTCESVFSVYIYIQEMYRIWTSLLCIGIMSCESNSPIDLTFLEGY